MAWEIDQESFIEWKQLLSRDDADLLRPSLLSTLQLLEAVRTCLASTTPLVDMSRVLV